MDNYQMPQTQPVQPGQPVQAMPQPSMPVGGPAPAPSKNVAVPMKNKDNSKLILIIVIVFLSVLMVTFMCLFVWKLMEWHEVSTDVDGQIAVAVAAAKDEQATQDEQEFLEREKYPYRNFAGPVDYGQLSFQYPKTWSLYVASDASKGGDYVAYFNPVQIDAISNTNAYALRVKIRNTSFEDVVAEYSRNLDQKDSNFRMESTTLTSGITANRYTGTIPGTELNGFIVVFKIRDKTAILQTDSTFFTEDFNKLLETVQFNA